ncbi:Tm-1-like ATP-binding domain-containing protein [Streptomyces sp. NPDC051567]|uniref:Tm-1-like ATP-binding domain-containing protein n=1 Tax=Streptomyces sp. NPDC051567 TaxID=3365660 RepID=UPI0037ACEBCA
MANVVLVGTLDTKGVAYGWLRERLLRAGVEVVLVDAGIRGEPRVPADVSRDEVARAAGTELARVRAADRDTAVATMARGAEAVVLRLHAEGRLHGVLAVGGGGGTALATRAMRALPLGVPKLMVSSVASGEVAPYVGSSDLTMMHSVVGVTGINRVSAPVLANAVEAVAAMAKAFARSSLRGGPPARPGAGSRPLIAASVAGVTTAGVDAARDRLTALGYEVLVLHTGGAGGRTLEALAGQGVFAGVLDLTLDELADDLCGGARTAGPGRLRAAGRAGVPQVVSPGALDMVRFGPLETLPERARYRRVRIHDASVTMTRTTEAECAELGRRVAARLRASRGPTAVCVPLRGLSTLGAPGGPYHDPAADRALFAALRDGLRGSAARLYDYDTHINDPSFGRAAADRLHAMIGAQRAVA